MRNYLNSNNVGIIVDLSEYYEVYNLIPNGEYSNTLKIIKNKMITVITEYQRVLQVLEDTGEEFIDVMVKQYLEKLLSHIKEYDKVINILK